MMAGSFLHPERIHLLWLAIAFVALLVWLNAEGRKKLGLFLSQKMSLRLVQNKRKWRTRVHLLFIAFTLFFSILALMRPQSSGLDETILAKESAAELMIVLDVSKSMLAEDAAPNRLARAKAEIRDLSRELPDHRMGLIAFAGRAVVLSPMTSDRSFFQLVLSDVGTKSVSRGGTQIGTAILKAVEGFNPGPGAKLIVLITDGEDHDSFPMDAAKEARDRGIRIISIGFGSEGGSPIEITDPITGGRKPLLDREGRVVISRLDGKLLREIALETEGMYVPAGTGVLDLESIVKSHILPMIQESGRVTTQAVRSEHYSIWVLAAFLSLILATWIRAGGRLQSARGHSPH